MPQNSRLPLLPLTLAEIGFILFFLLMTTFIIREVRNIEDNPPLTGAEKLCVEKLSTLNPEDRKEVIQKGVTAHLGEVTQEEIESIIQFKKDEGIPPILENCHKLRVLIERMRTAGKDVSPEDGQKEDADLIEDFVDIAQAAKKKGKTLDDVPDSIECECDTPEDREKAEANERIANELRRAGRGNETTEEVEKIAKEIANAAIKKNVKLPQIPESIGGKGFPPCWKDARGSNPDFLFVATIYENFTNFEIHEEHWNRLPHRREEALSTPGVKEIIKEKNLGVKQIIEKNNLNVKEIGEPGRKILRHSHDIGTSEQEAPCRHYVLMIDEAETKDGYKLQRQEIEEYFFKVEAKKDGQPRR